VPSSTLVARLLLGVRAVLTKPISRKELLAALHDNFQERRQLDQSQSAWRGTASAVP